MKQLLGLMVMAMIIVLAVPCSYATPIRFTAHLDGASEAPPNPSLGTGDTTVIIDTMAHTLFVDVTFSGLTGTTTASHIHCCTTLPMTATAGVATETPTFSGFPLGVTSGSYIMTFDLTDPLSYNAPFFNTNGGGTAAGAEAALEAGLLAGKAYLNIHSSFRTGGEIRGFLATPEPGTLGLLAIGLTALGITLRRRRG